MILTERNLCFDFKNALKAFRFDEQNSSLPAFHGLSHCMKAVDFIVEYKDKYFFVEIKDPPNTGVYASEDAKNDLIGDLVKKFRDTFLYRWAEGELNKSVYYCCLVELENAHVQYIMDKLKIQLPTRNIPKRWKNPIAKECLVSNIDTWNKTFPEIRVTRGAENNNAVP
jgi:hypothetical protein